MTEVSIELVPRSLASLDAELRTVAEQFPSVRTVNVPDLLRFPLRSWDACAHARHVVPTAIPHLRAMDFAPGRTFVLREKLASERVFWGISPVVGARTRAWWETKNHAFFPAAFEPTLAWSRDFAARALDWARGADTNLYFMPIRVDLATWLGGIL